MHIHIHIDSTTRIYNPIEMFAKVTKFEQVESKVNKLKTRMASNLRTHIGLAPLTVSPSFLPLSYIVILMSSNAFKCNDLSYAKFGNTTVSCNFIVVKSFQFGLSIFLFYFILKDCLIHLISFHSEHVSVCLFTIDCSVWYAVHNIAEVQATFFLSYTTIIIIVTVFVVVLCATRLFSWDNPHTLTIGKYTI